MTNQDFQKILDDSVRGITPELTKTVDRVTYTSVLENRLILLGGGHGLWSYTFFDCESLTRVTISEGIDVIQTGAFENCDFLSVPRGVKSKRGHSPKLAQSAIADDINLAVQPKAAPRYLYRLPRFALFNMYGFSLGLPFKIRVVTLFSNEDCPGPYGFSGTPRSHPVFRERHPRAAVGRGCSAHTDRWHPLFSTRRRPFPKAPPG